MKSLLFGFGNEKRYNNTGKSDRNEDCQNGENESRRLRINDNFVEFISEILKFPRLLRITEYPRTKKYNACNNRQKTNYKRTSNIFFCATNSMRTQYNRGNTKEQKTDNRQMRVRLVSFIHILGNRRLPPQNKEYNSKKIQEDGYNQQFSIHSFSFPLLFAILFKLLESSYRIFYFLRGRLAS